MSNAVWSRRFRPTTACWRGDSTTSCTQTTDRPGHCKISMLWLTGIRKFVIQMVKATLWWGTSTDLLPDRASQQTTRHLRIWLWWMSRVQARDHSSNLGQWRRLGEAPRAVWATWARCSITACWRAVSLWAGQGFLLTLSFNWAL